MGSLTPVAVFGLHDKVLECGHYRDGFSEELLGDSSYPMEPVPASFKVGPPLPRPSPSAAGGSTSGITNIRREKSYCSWREE